MYLSQNMGKALIGSNQRLKNRYLLLLLLAHSIKEKKQKDCLIQDNVSEWVNMSIHGLLFQLASTIKICVGLVQSGLHHHLIEN
jgi:hypothetical protein